MKINSPLEISIEKIRIRIPRWVVIILGSYIFGGDVLSTVHVSPQAGASCRQLEQVELLDFRKDGLEGNPHQLQH